MTQAFDPFSSGQQSFVFTTRQNEGAREVIPARVAVEPGAVLVAHFDGDESFRNYITAGSASYGQGQVTLLLDAGEVNRIQSGVFRILATVLNRTYLVASGRIDYIPGAGPTLSKAAVSGDYNDLKNRPTFSVDGAVVVGASEDSVDTAIATAMQTHVQAPLPHPVYDDMPALTLLFENGLM
jgi:hypothetical protein